MVEKINANSQNNKQQSQIKPVAEIAFSNDGIPNEWPKKIELKDNCIFNDGKKIELGPNGKITPEVAEKLKENGFTIFEQNGQTNVSRNYE